MTENKAIEELHRIRPYGGIIPQRRAEALDVAIKALEEVQQYRQIGTVEECREAVEKQKAKKPLHKRNGHYCPICNNYFDSRDWKSKYCGLCGQKLDWSDEA